MSGIHIITDSAAQFTDPTIVRRVSVLPHSIQFSGMQQPETTLSAAEFHRLATAAGGTLPVHHAVSAAQFTQTFQSLYAGADQLLCVLTSRVLSKTWDHAQEASRAFPGRASIHILDSQNISVGLGLLVQEAAQMAAANTPIETILQRLRKRTQTLFTMFYTDAYAYLKRGGMLSAQHSVLGEMLGVKPFVTLEDGALVTMEKSRNKSQTLDRLLDFAGEFVPDDPLYILHGFNPGELVRAVQVRLRTELGRAVTPAIIYGPTLATFIGPDAIGLVASQKG